jgi:hypothetical protein
VLLQLTVMLIMLLTQVLIMQPKGCLTRIKANAAAANIADKALTAVSRSPQTVGNS